MFSRVLLSVSVILALALAGCASPLGGPAAGPAAPSTSPAAVVRTGTVVAVASLPAGATSLDVLRAADSAYQQQDPASAATFYVQVASTGTGGDSSQPHTLAQAIIGYAGFRSVLALTVAGEAPSAADGVQEMRAQQPTNPFTTLTSEFWENYTMTADVATACSELGPDIAPEVGPALTQLEGAGISTGVTRLCTVPGSAPL